MDSQEFRECGKAAIDIIADYWDNIRTRYVLTIALFLKFHGAEFTKNATTIKWNGYAVPNFYPLDN